MTKTNEKFIELQDTMESNDVKNEYSRSILSNISESWDSIVERTEFQENKELWTFAEVQRVAKRTTILFNLLDELLVESSELNTAAIKQLMDIKREM